MLFVNIIQQSTNFYYIFGLRAGITALSWTYGKEHVFLVIQLQ